MPPLNGTIKCISCKCTESLLWKPIDVNQQICNDCFETNKICLRNEYEIGSSKSVERKTKLRKSTRSTRYNGKNGNGTSLAIPTNATGSATIKNPSVKFGGRGRRNLFKRAPMKAPTVSATTKYVKSLFYKGSYIQIGDIVSLCNSNYDIFYAQIRGLMVDSFCEKSAVITWLLPTQMSPSPNEKFDPSTYLIGPEEDQPRLLSCMEFVMHAPSDYYYNKNTPYPPTNCNVLGSSKNSKNGFIWTNIETN